MHLSKPFRILLSTKKLIISDKEKHNVTSILARLKDELNLQKDVDLAEFLGVAQNTISAWKKRDSVNYELIFDKVIPYNIDLNWLIYGKLMPQIVEDENLLETIRMAKENENFTEAEGKVMNVIEIIQRLPWSTSTRRLIMENYLYLVYNEQLELDKQKER
ncbi:MAG: hypothetical protein EA390_09385 [Balneolaceae bacterium]|nr:MAG: hypothetical protein EA390_09385 [Balneolaceae bacterium]